MPTPEAISPISQENKKTNDWLRYYQRYIDAISQQITSAELNRGKFYFIPLVTGNHTATLTLQETGDTQRSKGKGYDGEHQIIIQPTKDITFGQNVAVPKTDLTAYDERGDVFPIESGAIIKFPLDNSKGIGSPPVLAIIGPTFGNTPTLENTNGLLIWASGDVVPTTLLQGAIPED